MKTYDEAIKALEAIEDGADLVAAVKTKLETDVKVEKDKGIKDKNDANKEAKNLRDRLKKVTEPLGLDPEGEDFEERVTEFKTLKEKGATKPNVKLDPEFVQMKKDFDKIQTDLKARETKELAVREKTVKALKKVALAKAFTEKKIIPDATDDLMVALDGRVMVDDDDNVTWKGDAEGEVLTVEEGLGKFLAKPGKSIYVGNDQRPGGGGGPGAGGGSGTPAKEPTVEERRQQLNKLTRQAL